jgi:hypothetical protein
VVLRLLQIAAGTSTRSCRCTRTSCHDDRQRRAASACAYPANTFTTFAVGGRAVHLQEKRPEQFVDSIAAVSSQWLTKWFVKASDSKIAFL